MSASDEVVWLHKEYGTISLYASIDETVIELLKAKEAETRGEWKSLHIEIVDDYDSAHYISIQGLRPENAVEKAQRLYDFKAYEAREREQYERLKEKFDGPVKEKKG